MAPTITASFPQRKGLRSSSLATPKKKIIHEENVTPKSEVKRQCSNRSSRPSKKVTDISLRGVAQSPVKGSPIKKKTLILTPKKSTPKNNLVLEENVTPKSDVKQQNSSRSNKVTDSHLHGVAQSPIKGSPLKKKASSPLKSIQLNSPRKTQIKQALFEDSPKRALVLHKTDSHWLKAQNALSSSIPEEIFGREKQMNFLRSFLDTNLGDKTSSKKSKAHAKGSIYISGVPGTGKTTCLKLLLAERPVDACKVVFVNCMTIRHSEDIFKKLADAICPQKSYSDSRAAKKILEDEVQKSKPKILLVLDEVDQLDSQGMYLKFSQN